MTSHNGSSGLADAQQIGVLGATQGDLTYLLAAMGTMSGRGVKALLVLGDFGFLWPRTSSAEELDTISRELSIHDQTLFFVDGNHEDFTALNSYLVSGDGLRRVRPNVIHLPRGYRTVLASGVTLAALGGANSIDKDRRVEGKEWWAEESITDEDLATLGPDPVDILVGHDAPYPLPALDAALDATGHTRSEEMRAYARAGRLQFQRGFLRVRPKLYLGSHYYVAVDETVSYGDGVDEFDTRVFLLSANRSSRYSQAVLNVSNRDVEMFQPDNGAVMELTGRETGRWKVFTQSSQYLFDFDSGTVTRYPGQAASESINDTTRPLRAIERCKVGERGAWTMHPEGGYADPVDFYWQVSTEIRSIEKTRNREE